jgi:hypothetical protein
MNNPCLWLDSNVAWSPGKVRALATLAEKKGVRVVVHAQVHLEIWRQRNVRDGAEFDAQMIGSFLHQLGIQVFDAMLDRTAAERWGERLAQRYGNEWPRAKLEAVKARLPDGTSLPARRVPMTTDWLVALAVEDHDGFIAVEDKRGEWATLRDATPKRALTFEECLAWLEALPDSPAASQSPVGP